MIKVEPYWNVNVAAIAGGAVGAVIKVEPYWNVNLLSPPYKVNNISIKVEPYWNVNIYQVILPAINTLN